MTGWREVSLFAVTGAGVWTSLLGAWLDFERWQLLTTFAVLLPIGFVAGVLLYGLTRRRAEIPPAPFSLTAFWRR
ncbi:MAG: hypothetical protein MI806_25910 [Minwuiales bacterium]|nr:hypothetical protein [Minwuiales bacterium]